MKRTARYGVTGLLAVAAVVAILWPWLGSEARSGLAAAAATAWSVQVVAFGLLIRYRERTTGFLAVWAGGTVVRMALVLGAAWAVVELPSLPPVPTLLGLAGFFFGLLLMEPLFFGPAGEGPVGRAAAGTNNHA